MSGHVERHTHPAGHQQLVPELHGGVVEGELLTAQVVDGRVALQVQEQVVGEANLPWLLLKQRKQGSPLSGVGSQAEALLAARPAPLSPWTLICFSVCVCLPIAPLMQDKSTYYLQSGKAGPTTGIKIIRRTLSAG